MNRYALWKYIVIGVVLLIAALYTLPNFYGESPAVQVSSGKSTVKIDETVLARVEKALADAQRGKRPHVEELIRSRARDAQRRRELIGIQHRGKIFIVVVHV